MGKALLYERLANCTNMFIKRIWPDIYYTLLA